MILKNFLKFLSLLFVALVLSCSAEDGEDGINGTDGRDGINGIDGQDGINGTDGRDGINGIDGQDGVNGTDGRDGINGFDGQDGVNGTDGRDGINGVDGQDGVNGTDGRDGIGEIVGSINILITGDITDEEAQIEIHNKLGSNTRFIDIIGTTNLTSIDLSAITEAIEINIFDNEELSILNFSNLETVSSSLSIRSNQKLDNIDFSSLVLLGKGEFIDNFFAEISMPVLNEVFVQLLIRSANITSLNLPLLENGTFDFQVHSLSVIDLPQLTGGDVFIGNAITLTNLNLPLFSNGSILVNGTSITSLDFPSLRNSDFIRISDNSELTSINLSELENINNSISLTNNTLSSLDISSIFSFQSIEISESVDISSNLANDILSKLVSITPSITGKIIRISARFLTGQGAIDKQVLEDNNNEVFIDFNI